MIYAMLLPHCCTVANLTVSKLTVSKLSVQLCLIATLASGCTTYQSTVETASGDTPPREPAHTVDRQLGPVAAHRGARIERILQPLHFTDEHIEVRADARKAHALDDSTVLAQAALLEGRLQLATGLRVEALEHIAQAVVLAPESAEAFEALGRVLQTLGRTHQALAAFRTATRLEPKRVTSIAETARTLERLARWSEAVATWDEVLTLDPTDGMAHVRLAVDHLYLDDRRRARDHLQTAELLGTAPPAQLETLLGLRLELLLGLDDSQSTPSSTPEQAPAATRGSGAIIAGPMVRIDAGGGTSQSVETSVIRSAANPLDIVAAWNDLREPGTLEAWSLGVGLSQDGGATWNDFLLRAPGATIDNFEGDPMTAYDPRTGNLWVGGVTFFQGGNIFVARKAPGASTLDPVVVINDQNNFDKGWLAAGRGPDSPNTTNLYVAYNLGLQISTDLGTTWSGVQKLDPGIAQQPRIGPMGELYIAYWDFDDGVLLQRSFDGGTTISPPITMAQRMDVWGTQDGSRFPGRFRVPSLSYLAVDPNNGTLYCVYFDTTGVVDGQANIDLYFTRSQDRGDTWTTPRVINGDSDPPGDQFYPWLEVDTNGRLHLLYLDTRHTAQLDDTVNGMFDAYYATSANGGDSWIEARLTPTSFTSSDATWPGFEQFLGDFVGLSVAGDQILAVYPATINGDLDIFAQTIQLDETIFADGFESGDTSSWM